jgi:hypothetical protein
MMNGREMTMRRALLVPAALLLAGPACASAQQASSIGWSIEAAGPAKDGSEVQLTIDSRWNSQSRSTWSNRYAVADLRGLARAQVLGGPTPARFILTREAGKLDCSGSVGRGRGSGACNFAPDVGFATFLDARRIGRPDVRQSFSLTMSGVGRNLVDALDKGGFERPNIEQLTAMGIHGASAAYVRELAGSGYHLSADDLISFKIHGVKPEYVRELATIGPRLQHIAPSEVLSLKIHGVKAGYVRELAAIGPEFRSLTADDLVSFAIHGVSPALVQAYVRTERRPLQPEAVVSMAIHGVTADYIEQLAALGYSGLSAEDLVTMRIHGVTPEFVRSLRRAGMTRLSADQLVRLRLSGFDPRAR